MLFTLIIIIMIIIVDAHLLATSLLLKLPKLSCLIAGGGCSDWEDPDKHQWTGEIYSILIITI